ncbi:cellulase family glycosylhydrolase [Aestuariibaculum marinum]|uniref:Cellulase family glycosylhydrolase n=1 Tax=Aestuariibaculum marinum TaxID=2683592 RepID=A0A8J6U657_9FLAO|nr:cellulase family glycosylhydrolase [Aestuariibaculum marinum]MBD0822401.1 cellulase family glycosylhydrolase [Aestuariibaculum marinum]
MKSKNYILKSFMALFLIGIWSCSSDNDPVEVVEEKPVEKTLVVNVSEIDFENTEGYFELSIDTNIDSWVISTSGTSWLSLDKTTGSSGVSTVTISTENNSSIAARSAIITVNANGISAVKITVNQKGAFSSNGIYPDYNLNPIPADPTGMSSTAQEIAAKISLGWNLGNTLEATGGETAWGNPMVTKELITSVKANEFNAIRIPCSWNQYLEDETNAKLKESWLNRVKEVVQYCIDNDMHVILNIHWDGGWLENNVNETSKTNVNAKQKAFWEQIAIHLRDFDERLLFASANEPNAEDEGQMAVLNSYHQTFIDAVRSTGGKNAYRTLVVQGPSTDVEKTNTLMTNLPVDNVQNRLMVEVHYYTPYQFALMTEDATWGKMFYYWGANYHSSTDNSRNASWGEEADLQNYFKLMKSQFVDKGIPVVLGEFAAIKRENLSGENLQLHLNSRAYYLKSVVQQAKANGLLPFYWDAGNMGNHSSALFNRTNNTVYDQQALDALKDGLN